MYHVVAWPFFRGFAEAAALALRLAALRGMGEAGRAAAAMKSRTRG